MKCGILHLCQKSGTYEYLHQFNRAGGVYVHATGELFAVRAFPKTGFCSDSFIADAVDGTDLKTK